MKTIIHVLNINKRKNIIFDAIATGNGLSSWWSTKVNAEETLGGMVDFIFRDDFNPQMKITNMNKSDYLEWICFSGHIPWKDNRFSFELSKNGNTTQLKFIQKYATELSDEQYGIYNFNWGYYLNSLKLYCETGKGYPFNPDTL